MRKTQKLMRVLSLVLVWSLCLGLLATSGLKLTAKAATETTTVEFLPADFANEGTSGSGSQVDVSKNGVTVSASLGYGAGSDFRVYANSTLDISVSTGTISRVEITCTKAGDVKYGSGALTGSGYTWNDVVGTWSGDAKPVINLTSTKQVRMTSIVVTVTGGTTCNHVLDAGKVTKEATCTEAGVMTYTCTLKCGYTETEPIPVKEHTYGADGKCTGCGAQKPDSGETPTPTTGDIYKKITSTDELVTGKYVMVISTEDGYYAPSDLETGKSPWVTAVTPTVSGDTVTEATGAVWTLTVAKDTAGNYTAKLQDVDGTYIAPSSETGSGIKEGEYPWTVDFNTDNKTVQFLGVERNVALMSRSGYDYKLRAYKTTTTDKTYFRDFTLYKLDLSDKVVLDGVSATLKGNIGLNYYITLPESVKEGAYVQFTHHKATGVDVKSDKILANSETLYKDRTYKFTCPLSAKEMNDTVTFEVYDSSNNKLDLYFSTGARVPNSTHTYSLYKYFDALANDPSATDELKALAQATIHYGQYAQQAFHYNDEGLNLGEITEVDATTLEPYAMKTVGALPEGLEYNISLFLESETTICLYFNKLVTGLTLDGAPVTPEQTTDGRYCVKITNISAKDLDKEHTLVINDGCTRTFSALTYAHIYVTDPTVGTDANIRNAVKALYLYNQAADAYFPKEA